MLDLFTSKTSKIEELREWIFEQFRIKSWVRTSAVYSWGVENHSNRAVRNAQQMCADKEFRRMTPEEKEFFMCGTTEDVWVRNDFK